MKLFKKFDWKEVLLYIILPFGLILAVLQYFGLLKKWYYIVLNWIKPQSTIVTTTGPRGIRNNNPLNIKYSAANNWDGQIVPSSDLPFAQFTDIKYGARAAVKLLKNYITKYGANSIQLIINRWAPSSENPTSNMIDFVCSDSGIGRNEIISGSDRSKIVQIAHSMSKFELGGNYVDKSVFNNAYDML